MLFNWNCCIAGSLSQIVFSTFFFFFLTLIHNHTVLLLLSIAYVFNPEGICLIIGIKGKLLATVSVAICIFFQGHASIIHGYCCYVNAQLLNWLMLAKCVSVYGPYICLSSYIVWCVFAYCNVILYIFGLVFDSGVPRVDYTQNLVLHVFMVCSKCRNQYSARFTLRNGIVLCSKRLKILVLNYSLIDPTPTYHDK